MSKMIEVSDETFEKLKKEFGREVEEKEVNNFKDLIGGKFFFRTVTYHSVGKVKKQIGSFLELSDASWIADSGRFSNAIKTGSLNEIEPVGQMWINIETVVDFFPWKYDLPKEQK